MDACLQNCVVIDLLIKSAVRYPLMKLSINDVISQPARDVPGTSPEGPNVRDLQGTFRGLLGDQQKKKRSFNEKSAF